MTKPKPKSIKPLTEIPVDATPGAYFAQVADLAGQLNEIQHLLHQLQTPIDWHEALPKEAENHLWRLSQEGNCALISFDFGDERRDNPNAYIHYTAQNNAHIPGILTLRVPAGRIICVEPHADLAACGVLNPNRFLGPGTHHLQFTFVTTYMGITIRQNDLIARLIAFREG